MAIIKELIMDDNQIPSEYNEIIDEQLEIYNDGRSITKVNSIPKTKDIPIENEGHWNKIPDVICVYADMINSTKLSAKNHDQSTAGAYQLFTNTIVKLFHQIDAPYIDVKGDGVFALFNKNQVYTAFASAINVKTFAENVFVPKIKDNTDLDIGCHLGVDQKTVLVRKVGLKKYDDRTDRQNEVWAGKPVNMAAKLASKSNHSELLVSDRYFSKLEDDLVLYSCGCPGGEKAYLWEEINLEDDDIFDFDKAHKLESHWCENHGAEYFQNIIELDED
jgi:class 3 adenylate cyclase